MNTTLSLLVFLTKYYNFSKKLRKNHEKKFLQNFDYINQKRGKLFLNNSIKIEVKENRLHQEVKEGKRK